MPKPTHTGKAILTGKIITKNINTKAGEEVWVFSLGVRKSIKMPLSNNFVPGFNIWPKLLTNADPARH